jgi:hypothetical protein
LTGDAIGLFYVELINVNHDFTAIDDEQPKELIFGFITMGDEIIRGDRGSQKTGYHLALFTAL